MGDCWHKRLETVAILKPSLLRHVFFLNKQCCSMFWDYVSFCATQSLTFQGFALTRLSGDDFSCCLSTPVQPETTHRSQQKISLIIFQLYNLGKKKGGKCLCYLLWQTYFSTNCLSKLYLCFMSNGEGSAKTHISIDICMRVNIRIPATIISDASSCFFPPRYPSRDGNAEGFAARVPDQGSTCLTWAFVHKLFILTNSTASK